MPDAAHPGEGNGGSSQPSNGRGERALGRGLEDVSHLFLSRTNEPPAAVPPPPRAPERAAEPAPIAPDWSRDQRTVLLRPVTGVSRERLTAVLRDFENALEEGMRGIDANLPCDPFGEIDVVALDRVNQLTIVDVDTAGGADLLTRGLGHAEWVVRNLGLVRRLYHGQRINFALEPRLVLVAPSFPPLVGRAIRQAALHVRCFTYTTVDVPGGSGLLLQPVDPA